ncbi:MAG TPA: beta-carotene hydroxylase [Flavobacterium sp.]|jgi:beta-carotene 3-hydroxylase
METGFFIIVFIGTFLLMEGLTWLAHKYIMHGFLWNLHRDHHQQTNTFFEKNDWFFVIFAVPSIILIYRGVSDRNVAYAGLGFGIMAYGFAYFMIHDVIIHQRFKWFSKTNNPYLLGLRWGHKMHHKHLNKQHGECFGMLYVARKYRQKIYTDRLRAKERRIDTAQS